MSENLVLSEKERLALYNQFWMLSLIDIEQSEYCKQMMTILKSGYELEYQQLTSRFSRLSEEDCELVYNILVMYRSMEEAKERGNLPSKGDNFLFEYGGFDSNHESGLASYAKFLIGQPHAFRVLKSKADDSHISTLERYRFVYSVWDKLPNKHAMTREDFDHIASAWQDYREKN